MKKIFILIFTLVLAVTAMMGHSQGMATEDKELILTMQVGDVTYKIPASEIGEMTFTDNGATLIVRGREYKVADIASMSVAEEIPQPKKLVPINYRKGYQWYEPHDNLPLSYQYIVYRDSVFPDGSVHTMESRSSNTAMEWMLNLAGWTWEIGYNQGKEDLGGVIVYYFKANWYNDAYCNAKITRTIAVPNLSRITYLPNGTDTRDAHQLDSYLRWIDGKPYQFDVNNPEAGWYTRDFFYYDYGYVDENYMGGGGFLTQFSTESRWYNHLFYTEDDLNGKVLINFLGDENDIDNESYEAQFNVTVDEESFTMPTGEPAKVFSKKLVTTMLGRQFNYEVVDTAYQYDPAHPPF